RDRRRVVQAEPAGPALAVPVEGARLAMRTNASDPDIVLRGGRDRVELIFGSAGVGRTKRGAVPVVGPAARAGQPYVTGPRAADAQHECAGGSRIEPGPRGRGARAVAKATVGARRGVWGCSGGVAIAHGELPGPAAWELGDLEARDAAGGDREDKRERSA